MVPGSARNWIAVNAVNNPTSTKNENKKYDNSTIKKINRSVAFAAGISFHGASALLGVMALLTIVATAEAGQGAEGGRIQGTWEMQITLNDCAGHVIRSFPTLIEFAAGGTVTEASGVQPQLCKRGEKVFGAMPLPITMRFASKTSRSTLRTSLRAG